MSNTISNTDDVIDSRDVIARIEELESGRESLVEAISEAKEAAEQAETEFNDAGAETQEEDDASASLSETNQAVFDAEKELTDWDNSYDAEELKSLKSLANEGESSPDWAHGETLIHDDYF